MVRFLENERRREMANLVRRGGQPPFETEIESSGCGANAITFSRPFAVVTARGTKREFDWFFFDPACLIRRFQNGRQQQIR